MSLTQQYLMDLIAPPILTGVWWLLTRGFGIVVQGGQMSERTKVWQRNALFIVLVLGYLVMFGGTTYLHLVK